jgi:hypothetical protein
MARATAVALVQKIMDADYADEDEAYGVLEALSKALAVLPAT